MGTSVAALKTRNKKQVHWGVVSVLEFHMGYNASAVPETGGPPVGLVGRPIRHSCLMLSAEDDAKVTDSEWKCTDSASDTETKMVKAPKSLGYSRRSRKDLWMDPVWRARILMETYALATDDIALICRDVQATLNSRAFSQVGKVTEESRGCCSGCHSFPREKVLLYQVPSLL